MEYGKNYYNTTTLAQRIRDGATQGKVVKASGGLAGRITPNPISNAPDFKMIAANYIKEVQDMFTPTKEKLAALDIQSYLDEVDTKTSIENLSSPSASTEGRGNSGSFLDRLIQAESSGNSKAFRTNKDGKSYAGLVQIGQARLDDYNKAAGTSLKLGDITNNPDTEATVINWHIGDLTNLAQKLSAESGMDVNGLVAVGHLGGRTGMMKFAKGGYDPADELGTNLSDYYTRFKNK
jgi:hypothetical protein